MATKSSATTTARTTPITAKTPVVSLSPRTVTSTAVPMNVATYSSHEIRTGATSG
jgi:hypothetical protein